ncbi:MAG: thioredoxin domain-containing protein [Desulfobacterales bacterium]|nr:thioredoxin domain-containing protein [Desulfobacterales bacterium]
MAPNSLINEKSPYLLQHAHNPVDWHAWSDDTFELARRQNKPVFLSIGYATCHWCHVMEKESFEDETVARHLNNTFICIKVDREERPDIDAVYMAVCQMLIGSGGWPLNLFLTPDKKPFFAATYIPKNNRHGQAGLVELCEQVKKLWDSQLDKVENSATSIAAGLDRAFSYASSKEPGESLLEHAYEIAWQNFDSKHGGFEGAPKFPTPHRLLFLLRCYHRSNEAKALRMVEKTLTAMRLGGIWDHVGFGFHRYATDAHWLLPHFEKMLYDQALIAQTYLETYQVTQNRFYAQTAEDIFTYVLRDMTSPEGAFYSAEDADSEGEEGKFYVWHLDAFKEVLSGEPAAQWEQIFNLRPDGNFEDEATRRKTGANILHLDRHLAEWATELNLATDELSDQWERIRQKLYAAREKRIHPLKDDKNLVDWNGLMIAALSQAARVLNNSEYAAAAEKSAQFILTRMRTDNGRLYHRFREDELAVEAQAADYAFLIHGLLNLYQATFNLSYAEEAVALQEKMMADFWDPDKGGFYSTANQSEALPVRPKELYDGAMPSANSVSLLNLLWLSRLTGDPKWDGKAHEQLRAFSGTVKAQPTAFTYFLLGVDFALRPGQEVVITGDPDKADAQQMLAALNLNYAPHKVALVKSDQNAERLAKFAGFTDGLQLAQGKATAHICKGFACKEPTSDIQEMVDRLLGKQ